MPLVRKPEAARQANRTHSGSWKWIMGMWAEGTTAGHTEGKGLATSQEPWLWLLPLTCAQPPPSPRHPPTQAPGI